MGNLCQELLTRIAAAETAFRPIDEVLSEVATATSEILGADRVAIYLVLLPAGGVPDPSSQAYCGDTGALGRRRPELRELDSTADGMVVGDLRPHVVRQVDGRIHVRIKTPQALAWMWTQGVSSSRELTDDLTAVLSLLATSYRNVLPGKARADFYEHLLNLDSQRRYEHAQQRICEIWRSALQADWVWLWTYNREAKIYELAAEGSSNTGETLARGLPEPRTPVNCDNGIGHCVDDTQGPIYAADIANWQAEVDGKQYRVLLGDAIQQVGAGSSTCIPLLVEKGSAEPQGRCDVLCCYYRSKEPPRLQPDESLLHMGRWTRQILRAEQSAKRQRIQEDLMQLTQEYLTRLGSNPKKIRDAYLAELLGLIQKAVSAKGVSIFFKSRFTESIQCIASTGLMDSSARAIPFEEYPTVSYEPGERLTGTCYSENRVVISPTPETEYHNLGKYDEQRHNTYANEVDPLLMQPMPVHPTDVDQGAIGVIRATEHTSPTLPGIMCHFREEDAKTLCYLALQISPVLQTLNVRIEREESVAIIRHDLLTPMLMIRDTTEKLRANLEGKRAIRDRDLQNIEIEAYRALRLAQDLGGPDRLTPADIVKFPTMLEGDIVARIKAMLAHMADERDIRITFDDRFRSIPRLLIDPVLIERALVNVVVNAIKYGNKGSTIRIEASSARPDYFTVSVSNYGIGIAEEDRERIFMPNYRSDEAKRVAGPSVGLGLAIANRILQLHEGSLEITYLHEPTVFTLLIPKNARA